MDDKLMTSRGKPDKKGPEFEWLYIDIHQKDGYDFVFSFHLKPFMSHFEVSIFDVFVYAQNQPQLHTYLLLSPQTLNITREKNGLKSISHTTFRFERNAKNLKLVVRGKTLELELFMESSLRSSAVRDFQFPAESKALASFHWLLYMPLARCSGRLRIKRKNDWQEFGINGLGYCDGNRGRFNLKKALKSWLWMKIYEDDTLWLVGKIVPRHESEKNIIVCVRPDGVRHTFDAQVVLQKQHLRLKSLWGEQTFNLKESYSLDVLRFLVPVWPKALQWMEKLREVFAAFALKYRAPYFVRKIVTNGEYRRHRYFATDAQGNKVEIFGEEMDLNG